VTTDIVTDVLVIWEFYVAEKMVVFYVGVVILCCAQLSYLLLFFLCFIADSAIRTEGRCRWFKVFLVMILVAPFGQLVPLFMWVESHRFHWLDNLLDKMGLDNTGREAQMREGQDPLLFWIQSKGRKHGGFIIESVIEALPQSILQIVALLAYEHATALSLYSIVSSMTSVAIRGVIVSYSMNRATYVFNCVCFAADIFNVFSCFSWVFHDSMIVFPWTVSFWNFADQKDILGQIWFDQLLCITTILSFIMFLFLLTLFTVVLIDIMHPRNCRCETCHGDCSFGDMIESFFLVCVIFPAGFVIILTAGFTGLGVLLMVCQIFKLWPWCFLFTCWESDTIARHELFYGQWVNWLLSSPKSYDKECRIGISFRTLAKKQWLQSRSISSEVLKIPFDKLTCKVLKRDILGMSPNIKHVCCEIPRGIALDYSRNDNFTELRNGRGLSADEWLWLQKFVYGWTRFCTGLVLYILLPLHIVSLLYNLIFPFLAFYQAGYGAQDIQIILTSTYFFLLGIALMLCPAMFRYRSLITTLPIGAITLNGTYDFVGNQWRWQNPDLQELFTSVQEEYSKELTKKCIEKIVQDFFRSLAPLMLEFMGPQCHLISLPGVYFSRNPLHFSDPDRLTIFEVGNIKAISILPVTNKCKVLRSINDESLESPLLYSMHSMDERV